MLFSIRIFCLFSIFLLHSVRADCGCNKNREPLENEELLVPVSEDIEKIPCTKCDELSRDFNKVLQKVDEEEELYEEKIQVGEDKSWVFDMRLIPGGSRMIGTNEPVFPADKESPEKQYEVLPFYIDRMEVSNEQFQEFVDTTNYVTEAEKFGDSFVFKQQLSDEVQKEYEDFRVVNAEWWFKIKGADWRHPKGPDSSIKGLEKYPVIHVSWNDANNYCKWRNRRLPTEVEWETACRGGKKGKLFPWGNKLMPKNEHWMNIWQGEFPDKNSKDDGFEYLCPVDQFRQNDYDLFNIVGNVWEWTSDYWSEKDKQAKNPNRVRKGGSYLCHKSYCYRYRCAARSQNTEDSAADNLGFRCARDLEEDLRKPETVEDIPPTFENAPKVMEKLEL